MRTAAVALLLVASPLAAQDLPQGVRARVWSHQAGVNVGILSGQLASTIVLTEEPPTGGCREEVASSSAVVWNAPGGPLFATGRTYAPVACPLGTVAIPGPDVTRIDLSDGFDSSTQDTMGALGLLAGAGLGYFMKARVLDEFDDDFEPVYRKETSWWRVGLGALAGSLVGYLLAPAPEEIWRQIR